MDCRRVDEWLPAYMEDALTSRRARAVAAHLEACPRCRREQRALQDAMGALDRVGRRTPSIDLWNSFATRLAAEAAAPRRPLLGGVPVLRWPFAFAGSLSLAAGACVLALTFAGSGPLEEPVRGGTRASPGMVALRAASTSEAEGRQSAPAAIQALPPVRSPERMTDGVSSVVAVTVTAPRQIAVPTRQPTAADAKAAPAAPPERTRLAAIPSAELATVADALMDAQQDAARAQVASEVITLAEEMVRVSTPRDEQGEGRS